MNFKHLWVLLAELHAELEDLKLRVDWIDIQATAPYDEEDSEIFSRQRPADPYAEPIDHNGNPGAADRNHREQRRRENIREARRNGSHIRQIRRELDAKVATLERQGKHNEARALRAGLRDCVDTGNKGLRWVADHIDLENGRLCVGKVRSGDTDFDIFLKIDRAAPSIEFGISIEF